MIEIVTLTADYATGWQLFPIGMKRVADFCTKYDSDADPVMMCGVIMREFVSPDPKAVIMLAVEMAPNKEIGVVGHLLVSLEEWFGTKMANIIQYETNDGAKIPRAQAKACMAEVERWAKAHGAKSIRCMARNDKVARAFRIFFGMKPQRVVMTKPLELTLVAVGEPPSTGMETAQNEGVN